MKRIIVFIGIVLGIIFFTQCNKTTGVDNYSSDELTTRSERALLNANYIVPIEIALKISDLNMYKNNNKKTREIENYFTIYDNDSIPALYIINYIDNNGYLVVSADLRIRPVLANVFIGNFPDYEAPSMVYEWFDVTLKDIDLIRRGKIDNTQRGISNWKHIIGVNTNKENNIVTERCCEECPNYPECLLDYRIGCGGDPEDYCEKIDPCGDWWQESVGPLMSTTWGQDCTYNNLCDWERCGTDLLNCPGNCNNNPLTGCVATAMAQLIRYWQIPSSQSYNYSSMPDNFGNNEVQRLMYDAGCSVDMHWGCEGSGANAANVPDALISIFDFGSAIRENFNATDFEVVKSNIKNNAPVLFEGCRSTKTFLGIPVDFSCHEWVCDGYREYGNDCYEYLAFYMNWGWDGRQNGWFGFNDWHTGERNYQYFQKFVHEIYP